MLSYTPQYVLLAALLHLAGKQELVENEVSLLEVENDVKLADVAIVLVHLLDIAMDDFERNQLIVGRVASGDEEERGVAAVDDLCICMLVSRAKTLSSRGILTLILEKVAHAGAAGKDKLRDVLDYLCLFLGCQRGEPFG